MLITISQKQTLPKQHNLCSNLVFFILNCSSYLIKRRIRLWLHILQRQMIGFSFFVIFVRCHFHHCCWVTPAFLYLLVEGFERILSFNILFPWETQFGLVKENPLRASSAWTASFRFSNVHKRKSWTSLHTRSFRAPRKPAAICLP
jgi:hypothetical protein